MKITKEMLEKPDELLNEYKYFLVSFISPENIANCKMRAIKIRGVYKTEEEGRKDAQRLIKTSPLNIFMGEIGKLCLWDPTIEGAEEVKTGLQEKDDLYNSYVRSVNKSDRVLMKRKNVASQKDKERKKLEVLKKLEEMKKKMNN